VWTIDARDTAAPVLQPRRVLAAERMPTTPFIVFHPWSGGFRGQMKEWSPNNWVALGIELQKLGWIIVVTGSQADVHRAEVIASALGAFGGKAVNAAGNYTLIELTDVLVASDAVVSVNTGIMHLAALLGAVTISLEGPTPVHRWGPIGPRASSVVTPLQGCGFLDLGFEYDGERADCMEGITVDAVKAAVLGALQTGADPKRIQVGSDSV
jgi:heptosyltransferase I